MDFHNKLTKLLGNDMSIDEVQIDPKVIDEIIKIAINADPHEYVALLSGNVKKNILKVTGLIFLPYKSSETSAVMEVFMKPMTTKAVGSIHSHPGPSAQPSGADLRFFAKNGYFHMIICKPYSEATIMSYDAFGNPLPFVVKDLSDELEIQQLDDDDIDKKYFDEDFIKELQNLDDEEDIIDIKNINNINEDVLDEVKPLTNENISEETDMTQKQNEQKPKTAMLNLEFEIKGKKVVKEIPLPPEYEPGDQVEVDVRTDKTPNDDIDEINVRVKKVPKNSKVITMTPGRNRNPQQAIPVNPEKKFETDIKQDIQDASEKSSEEIEREIKQMEEDIAKLKAENERLKNNL